MRVCPSVGRSDGRSDLWRAYGILVLIKQKLYSAVLIDKTFCLSSTEACFVILSVWAWSLVQFTLVLTAKKKKKNIPAEGEMNLFEPCQVQ